MGQNEQLVEMILSVLQRWFAYESWENDPDLEGLAEEIYQEIGL